jgi:transcriptional regulator with PAS, ATPase and Fis domain
MNLKNIHIGSLIRQKVLENEIDQVRLCKYLKCSEKEVDAMYKEENLSTSFLLKWSKLLEYDFFRLYSQHLILYAPQSNMGYKQVEKGKKSKLPQFRKNIYTKDVIDFILELLEKGEKTKLQVIEEYKIPKTTLYNWINKYRKQTTSD